MEKQIMSLMLMFFIGTSVFFAQNPQLKGNPQGNLDQQNRRNEMNEIAKSKLELSDDQTKKWDEIHASYFKSLDDLRKDENLSKEDKKIQMKELRKSKDDSINAILTDEQSIKLADLRKEMREEQRNVNASLKKDNNRGPGQGNGQGLKVKEELNLSEDQSKKWDQIQDSYHKKIQEVMKDDSIDNELKHETKNALRDEMLGELMGILDDDQKALLSSKMKENRKQ